MTTRLKTRTDYHDVFNSDHSGQAIGIYSWLKPLFWLVIGAVLGMSYNKKAVDSCYDLLAFSEAEKTTVVATTTAPPPPVVIAQPATHATARGNVSASKA